MKFRAFPVGLGLVGMIACFPVIKMAIAQTAPAEQDTEPFVYAPSERELACDRVFNELAEVSADGSSAFFDDFKGITLSAEQQAAYDEFNAQTERKTAEVSQRAERAENPNGTLSFAGYAEMPPEVQAFIQNALDNSTSGQWREWNQKLAELGYDQYGQFQGQTMIYYTPELDRELDQIYQSFYAQVLSIMTPEQLPQARENLANRLRINEVCDRRGPVSISGVEPDVPTAN